MRSNKIKHLPDLILIFSLIIVSVSLLLIFNLNKDSGAYVVVRVNGIETDRFNLNESGTYSLNGGTNILIIEDGVAYLLEADCPDKLCVKMGKIQYTNECITCLPNKLTITVYGRDNDIDIH